MGMARRGARDDLPVQVIERGKQRDGAMKVVIVRLCPDMPGAQGQPRLGALQCLRGFRPRPDASFNPARPSLSNRLDHFETHVTLTPNSWATSSTFSPRAR